MRDFSEMSHAEMLKYNQEVFERLVETSVSCLKLMLDYKTLKQLWDDSVAVALLEGSIVGKNEAERHGMAIELHPNQYATLLETETQYREAEIAMKSAQIEANYIDRAIRIMETTLASSRSSFDYDSTP